ncbi:hypothetical protein B0T26DRAFT_659400 [Lasiosphaeria miniovina]|uniref:Acid phosphatase-like protein n=1 Tax=Lasiosphaeria miniovina TaxID=1954250 RepID=A0AA40DIA1_9PEZI|nr:uncharacterized protein B0T26DRAFT_659400 [Lasiosphaeria miniovina]KAK0701827.1 hypothetical protein B0T26DRAFT_659400 [Lasiosphaeria miniovina]
MHPAIIAVIVIVLLLLAAGVGWVVFARLRAQRLGLPPPPFTSYLPFVKSKPSAAPYGPPQPAPGGIVGWFNDRIRMFKNRNSRTAAGAYEQSGGPGGGRRGFGPLDPDEAWDSRVGGHHDGGDGYGYYEEQELGLAPQHSAAVGDTSYRGGGAPAPDDDGSYQMNLAVDESRGRTRSRSPGYAVTGGAQPSNPFEDDAEPSNMSLRGISPRPIDTTSAVAAGKKPAKGPGDDDNSPTERKSIFREDV